MICGSVDWEWEVALVLKHDGILPWRIVPFPSNRMVQALVRLKEEQYLS